MGFNKPETDIEEEYNGPSKLMEKLL